MRLKRVSLEEIDLRDQRYRIAYFFSLENLIRSIQRIGLINPPVVTFRDERVIPVTGWKRLLACKKLSLSSIPVFVCREKDDLTAFRLAVSENLANRDFNLVERAEIVKKLLAFGEAEQKIIREYLPLLGSPPTFDYFELYQKISRMSKAVKSLVHEKDMALGVVERLVRFSPRERVFLLPLLEFSSQNKQKELLDLVKEISLKHGIPVMDIFCAAELKTVIDSQVFSPGQKADRIRMLLRKRRYPLLSTRQEAFESSRGKMGWPRNIQICPTAFFEDEEAHVQFSFKTKKEYLSKLSFLRRMAAQEDFAALIASLSDE